MKFKLFFAALLLFLINSYSNAQTTYFIKYKDEVQQSSIDAAIQKQQIYTTANRVQLSSINIKVKPFARGLSSSIPGLSKIVKVTFPRGFITQNTLQTLQADASIEYIQKANTYKIEFTPNDSLLNQQWALSKIDAFKAWNISMGSDSVLLGIIDTGIDYLHPDLKNKIFYNPGEEGTDANGNDKRSNGIDDDGNGFIDDYMGWDFTDRQGFPFDSSGGDYLTWDNNPMDENGHGTSVAGIAAAETNNETGIAGIAPLIKVLNLRAFDPSGYGEEDDVAAAILYAVKMGVKVINMSFGDTQFSYVLRDVIRYAYSQNVVLVGSSGNSGNSELHYPSGYPEVISVGNSTDKDYISQSSSYGSTLDLVAPGSLIMATENGGGYRLISGTSAAAPFVSASAGLILSLGNFTNEEVKQILVSTTDDIESPGWDLRSGAGRLNLFNALSVLAPAKIKFNYPSQDYSTSGDSLNINASILSPYFVSYNLDYGIGLNPGNWMSLLKDVKYQANSKNIFTLDLKGLKDTVYTLRLTVALNNGRTGEERVNFYIDHTPPEVHLVASGPAFYGNKKTILAAVYTSEPCIVKMYYRKYGSGSEFNYITLDGFATNNEFVKYLHYGFIPTNLIEINSRYEVYYEAVNLGRMKTVVKNKNSNFIYSTDLNLSLSSEYKLPYVLPAGTIFDQPMNLTSGSFNEVGIREDSSPQNTNIYKVENNTLVKIDSLQNMILKTYGDFNNNGKKDLLSYFVHDGYILEQKEAGTTTFNEKYSNTSGEFWPVTAQDLDGDGITEVLTVDSDTSLIVWKLNNDLSVQDSIKLPNFSQNGNWLNLIDSPNAAVTDINGDGKKEIWMLDKDGDIFSYKVNGVNDYQKFAEITTGFEGSAGYITAGDYLGDSKKEIAVLLHSIDNYDIAPFHRLLIFGLSADSLNIFYDETFIDPSSEFTTAFQKADNSIKFADIDNDNKDELVLFAFPYSYIFKYESGKTSIISYKENINSNSVFIGDLNNNGVPEVAFPSSKGINFYEFAVSQKASVPYNLSGYSIDSSKIALSWSGEGNRFIIYRGIDKNNLSIIDSTVGKNYVDETVKNKTYYYYAVKSFNSSKQQNYSDLTETIKVYSHNSAIPVQVISNSSSSVSILFSERINTTVESLKSFKVQGAGYPNSISPSTQYSYLLSFDDDLPVGSNSLIIAGLRDYYGSPVKNDTIAFTVLPKETAGEFFISSHEIISPYKIRLTYNLNVDETSAGNINNYSFAPANSVESIDFDASDKHTIYLNLKHEKPVGSIGKEYRLHVKNVYSSQNSGKLKINEEAGSYIVLTGYKDNLSDLYVYPSPAKINGGSGKITFANLPQRAKITIFTLEGKQVKTIEETDGNGGVDYDLRDESGRLINSGVYIYRIVRLDDSNSEVEEKLGKFAVTQ